MISTPMLWYALAKFNENREEGERANIPGEVLITCMVVDVVGYVAVLAAVIAL